MSAAAPLPSTVRAPGSPMAVRWKARVLLRILRLVGHLVLVAIGLALAWLLVSAELAREREAGCHYRSYRDPVTGRRVERPCQAM